MSEAGGNVPARIFFLAKRRFGIIIEYMNRKIETALIEHGYREMIASEENTGYRIYYDMMKSLVNAVIFVDAWRYGETFIKTFKESMTSTMERIGKTTHYHMVVFIDSEKETYVEDFSVARQVCSDNPFAWIYDEAKEELIIYESQTEDFYGLKTILEDAKDIVVQEGPVVKESKKESFKKKISRVPIATSILVFINVVVFLICTFTGDLLYNKGAVGITFLTDYTQYYRVISSMFLHADISHIFGNMILLFFVGELVEEKVGSIRFLLIYLFSGIWGCVANFIYEIVTNDYVMAVGASGAVFGILGCLLALVVFKVVRGRTISLWRIIFVIAISLYEGFHSANVANWAHIGGLVAGFLLGVIYCLTSVHRKTKGNKNEN